MKRRAPHILMAGLLFGYGLLITFFSIKGFPAGLRTEARMPYLADKPVGEDGFYMLTVAWNAGSGEGLVYNFDRTTTGIQPLATLVYALIAFILTSLDADKWTFVRMIVAFGTVNLLVFAWQMGQIARIIAEKQNAAESIAKVSAHTTALIAGSSFYLFRVFTYGLETGIYLTLFAATVAQVLKHDFVESKWPRVLAIGALIGLTALARIDFVIIIGAASLIAIVGARQLRRRVLAISVVAAAFFAPWILWVHSVSGSWMPSSGSAQMSFELSVGRLSTIANAILQQLAPWLLGGGRNLMALFQVASLLAIVLWARRRVPFSALFPAHADTRHAYAVLLCATLLLIPAYLLFFWAGHFYARYLSPLLVFSLPMAGALLSRLIAGRRTYRVAFLLMLFVAFSLQAVVSLHRGRVGNTHALAAGYIQRFHSNEKVGAFQSGALGFFNANVFNLDGKIDRDALIAWRTNSMDEYLNTLGVTVVIDSPVEIARLQARYAELATWRSCAGPVPSTHHCIQRD